MVVPLPVEGPAEPPTAPVATVAEGEPSSGAYARELIQHQIRRLGKLQPDVLADHDPEPLHQLRVSLRQLRTVLIQFGPALVLPESVSDRRIASLARRTGLCRDLDVLKLRLKHDLLPRLPDEEQHALGAALRRLEKDRGQAFASVTEALRDARYLKLLERLHKWQKRPRFTALGERPLLAWLADWQAPFTATLFLHPGWFEQDPAAESLHDLRKRIKAARYALENLEPWCDRGLKAWIQDLRQSQDHLGELHDLQVLSRTFAESDRLRRSSLTALQNELEHQQQEQWLQWRAQAERLLADTARHAIQRELRALSLLPSGSPQTLPLNSGL
ncbi:MAG: CHAD domain-containing protein [Cyanobium sp.]